MKCPLCNAQIKEGSLYCEACGEDIHIVPDFDPVIDDASNEIIGNMTQSIFNEPQEKPAEKKSVSEAAINTPAAENGKEVSGKASAAREKARKLALINIPKPLNYILVAVFFALIFLLTALAFFYFTSDDYKLEQADSAYGRGEYEKASVLYEELLRNNKYDPDLLEKYCLAVYGEGNLEKYEQLLFEIYDNSYSSDSQRNSALSQLISIYDSRGDYEKIQDFVLATGDEELRKTYSKYFPAPPVIATEDGEYQLPQLLIINNDDKDCKIFYTITCTIGEEEPVTEEAKEYTGSVLLDEGSYDITAWCESTNGVKSDEVHGKITILFLPPAAPVITPANGTYYEPNMIEIENYTEGDLKFYYTTDGTIPTVSSNIYSGPLVMLPGNSVYKFVCIDDNGLLSDISTVKYNFKIEYNVSAEKAHDELLNYLYQKGTTSGPDGALETGGMVGFRLIRIDHDIIGYKYIFEEYIFNDNGELTELDTRYSVDLITGEVEKAE